MVSTISGFVLSCRLESYPSVSLGGCIGVLRGLGARKCKRLGVQPDLYDIFKPYGCDLAHSSD